MAVDLSPIGGAGAQFFDNNGVPLSGGKLYTYAAATTTPKASYTSAAGTVPHSNPIILDSAGRVPGGEIWLTSGEGYKFVLETPTSILLGTWDNIYGYTSGSAAASMEVQTATAGQTLFVLTTMAYNPGTNTLGVYVDGVNQVVNNAYIETNSTSVTFVSGLHAGAVVKFININIASTTANVVTYAPGYTGSVATTVEDKLREYVSVKDFGAIGDGVADDTAAIQAALDSGAGSILVPKGTYSISSTLTLNSDTQIFGDGYGSEIICNDGDISQLKLDAVTNCVVRDLSINVTAVGTTAYVAGVEISNGSSQCLVQNVHFSGMSWAGVWITDSNDNRVLNCFFENWQGTVQDAADVCVYSSSFRNIVADNKLYGNGSHGVLVQDPYAGSYPVDTVVRNNYVGEHQAYGITVYMPAGVGIVNTNTLVDGNTVENIQGSISTNRSSGAGIYLAGGWIGGTIVTNNTVRNCCVQTLNRTLLPAGISVNGTPLGAAVPLIANNVIYDMPQGDGIYIASAPGGANIENNSITVPATNNGAGPGGIDLLGNGIRIAASSNVSMTNNNVRSYNTSSAVFLYALNVDQNNITINGGHLYSASFATLYTDATAGRFNKNLTVSGVRVENGGATNYAISILKSQNVTLTGNFATASNFAALRLLDVTNGTVTGGYYRNSSTPSIVLNGTCTNTYIDQSVFFGTSSADMQNVSTGGNVAWRNPSSPSVGNWAVGDRIENSAPAVGQPKGWICTVAGVPGTWVSEGNL